LLGASASLVPRRFQPSRTLENRRVYAPLALLLAASPLAAQISTISDSATAARQAGQWEQLGALAARGIVASNAPEDRCQFFLDGVLAATHLWRFASAPGRLQAFEAQCGRSEVAALEPAMPDTIAVAVTSAARFLPAGAAEHAVPPLVTITFFASDGYSQQPGIVLDLYHVRENGLTNFLSHEFHHSLSSRVDRVGQVTGAYARLYQPLPALRNEGIADMIDKPHPLTGPPGMQWYATAYNAACDATPAKLRLLDTLLVVAAADSSVANAAADKARGAGIRRRSHRKQSRCSTRWRSAARRSIARQSGAKKRVVADYWATDDRDRLSHVTSRVSLLANEMSLPIIRRLSVACDLDVHLRGCSDAAPPRRITHPARETHTTSRRRRR